MTFTSWEMKVGVLLLGMEQLLWKMLGQFLINKRTLTKAPSNPTPRYLFERNEKKVCVHRNLYAYVYSEFIHSCPQTGAPDVDHVVNGQTQCWYPSAMEYCSRIKRDGLPPHAITRRNLRCITLTEGSWMYCVIPLM